LEIKISATEEDKAAVLKAISELNAIPHIKHMSQARIAEHAGLKETKVRAALIDLLTEKKITQYQATENPRLQRFYYVINSIGSKQ
jgi:DNA-binding Lrp family transcriptional regulator